MLHLNLKEASDRHLTLEALSFHIGICKGGGETERGFYNGIHAEG